MSMNQQPPKSAQEIIKLKRPRSVAVYDDYVDAAHAVDYLADRQFPVATLAIVVLWWFRFPALRDVDRFADVIADR